MVPETGVEPVRQKATDFKSVTSTNFVTRGIFHIVLQSIYMYLNINQMQGGLAYTIRTCSNGVEVRGFIQLTEREMYI